MLVRRAEDDDVDPGAWENAGGEIDGQEELLDALLREVREEVQIKVVPKRILYANLKRGKEIGSFWLTYVKRKKQK